MRFVVVRHGETDWNLNGRMQGHAPVPLNETGREQADRVGRYLAREYEFDRVVSSDLLRTRETTARIREHVGEVPVEFDPAWRERDLGVYQGLSYPDMHERFPEFGLGEAAVRAAEEVPENGESLLQVRGRVVSAWESLVESSADGETTLVVTHGGPIYLLLGHAKSMDIDDALLEHSQSNCGVNEFHHDGRIRLVRENVTEWDDGEAIDGAFGSADGRAAGE
jgi:probable phosphoglycerate mutase